VEDLVCQDSNFSTNAFRNTQSMKADECVRDMVGATVIYLHRAYKMVRHFRTPHTLYVYDTATNIPWAEHIIVSSVENNGVVSVVTFNQVNWWWAP